MSSSKRKTNVFKLMIGVFVALLIVGYGWTRSGKPAVSTDTAISQPTIVGNEEQVKSLIVQLYKWKDQNLPDGDFIPLSDDNGVNYTGIDFDKHNSRLEVLRRTGFFSDEFLANYDGIAKAIDGKLKNGEFKWLVGDLPPFGSGINLWCSCQDYPSDSSWDGIAITINSIDDKAASLSWTWGHPDWAEGFSYSINAVKVNDSWKLSYLQGFDNIIIRKI